MNSPKLNAGDILTRFMGKVMVLFMTACSTPAWATPISEIFPICATPSSTSTRVLTVDPSARRPSSYPSISAALQAAKPDDTIALVTGDYGELSLKGSNRSGFITIAAAQGQSPRFTKIRITGASRWRLTGLTVSGFAATTEGTLVAISASDNIVFDNNALHSQPGTMAWNRYVPGSPDTPSHGISARQSFCISIQDNNIRNIFTGVDFGGDQQNNNGKFFLVSGNTINNFAGDGIDHYGSHVRILNNRITDAHNLCDNKCVHSDGIQGWVYNRLPMVNTDIAVDSNTIIAQTRPDLASPTTTLQGITIFDGKWDGVKITNNLVIVNAWHGITLNRVNNGAIINNTVAPVNTGNMKPWIMSNRGRDDPTFGNVIIRNNIWWGKSGPPPATPTPGIIGDHNVTLPGASFTEAFVKFDLDRFDFDMRPSRRSPLIGAGSRDGAPAADIEGRPRTGAIDVGAYAYPQQ